MKVIGNKSQEWYTPPDLLNLIYQVMDIDLDPASPEPPTVITKKYYTKENDGLNKPWLGNIYLNPPYGREISAWILKLCNEWENFNIQSAIVLIPNKTDTRWFSHLAGYATCFCTITGRISFLHPNSSSNMYGTFGNILVLMSNDKKIIHRFINTFSDIGYIWSHYWNGLR